MRQTHQKLKETMRKKLEEWLGAAISEYPSSGQELDVFYWSSHVGMRSSILDLHEKRDLEKMNQLLNDADVFFSNRRPGYKERFGRTADELCSKHPGPIHAKVVLHGETGPWSNRTGFDEVEGAATGYSH